jgi:imidazolonepropionase-like amidohydrolase
MLHAKFTVHFQLDQKDALMKRLWLWVAVVLVCAAPAAAQEKARAYVGAEIIPIAGAPIKNGVLLIQGGKIVAVGEKGSVKVPSDAVVVDVSGKVIMPGLVDSHSHIGGPAGGDGSSPIQSDVRVLDSIDVRESSMMRARAGGITTVNIMPGSGHLSSGQTVYVKLRRGNTIEDLALRDAQGNILGGMKMANGTNSIRAGGTGPFPGTRAKSVSLVREQLIKAQEYREKLRKAGDDASKRPPRDLLMEALVEVLDGKRIVHFHTHRHDDILSVLRLQKEFGFRVVLHHVSEGWKVAKEIAAAGDACSVIVIDSPGGKLEAVDMRLETAAILDQAGVMVGFHTDDYITDSRLFLRSAGLAVRAGLPREKALYAMTMAGARMLDLQDRVGTLEKGKDADFLVLSGDPLSVYTHVLQTYVEGNTVFDRNKPEDRLFATGGYGVGSDQELDTDDADKDDEGGDQ